MSIAAEINTQPAQEWLSEQYLPFSLYAIRSRALVGTDGLKPVNRRILYSLYRKGVTADSKHLKAARAAAECVSLHPHGTSSIESALARMAQSFSLRIPLIDPYGTVGTVTGDTPAAARYWECRLSKPAMELLTELDEGAVEMGKNFDGELDEPYELPIRWPVSVINGTSGISVGYASSIPSHNPTEVMRACVAMVRNPDMSTDELMEYMPGPDFPTGGQVFGDIKKYYETGKGSFTVRASYTTQALSRGKTRIVFHELPYQVSAASVCEKLVDVEQITNVKDLTDKQHGMRLVVDTKMGSDPDEVLNYLFDHTQLQTSFSVNSTVLVDGVPDVVSMRELLGQFIEFRKMCVSNKTRVKIDKVTSQLHRLDGLLTVLADIDTCVDLIRSSTTQKQAKEKLCSRFGVDDEQADHVLSLTLRSLTNSDVVALRKKHDTLVDRLDELKKIVSSDECLCGEVVSELMETADVIADSRRTLIASPHSRDAKKTWQVQVSNRGRVRKVAGTHTDDESTVVVFSDGMAYRVRLSDMAPERTLTAIDMGIDTEAEIVAVGCAPMLLGTRNGMVKVVKEFPTNKDTFRVFGLSDSDVVVSGGECNGRFVSVSSDGTVLVCDDPRHTGPASSGVRGQKLKPGQHVVGVHPYSELLYTATSTTMKTTCCDDIPVKGRGSQGVIVHKLSKNDDSLHIVSSLTNVASSENLPQVSKRATTGEKLDKTFNTLWTC